MILNPVAREANLFVQIYQCIPLSVRNLCALVLAFCAVFFVVHVIVKVTG